jgi:hypothetical protein
MRVLVLCLCVVVMGGCLSTRHYTIRDYPINLQDQSDIELVPVTWVRHQFPCLLCALPNGQNAMLRTTFEEFFVPSERIESKRFSGQQEVNTKKAIRKHLVFERINPISIRIGSTMITYSDLLNRLGVKSIDSWDQMLLVTSINPVILILSDTTPTKVFHNDALESWSRKLYDSYNDMTEDEQRAFSESRPFSKEESITTGLYSWNPRYSSNVYGPNLPLYIAPIDYTQYDHVKVVFDD